jgi:hypothetical protein
MLMAQTSTSLKEEGTTLRNYKAKAAGKLEPPQQSWSCPLCYQGRAGLGIGGCTCTPNLLDCNGVQRYTATHAPELHDATPKGTILDKPKNPPRTEQTRASTKK